MLNYYTIDTEFGKNIIINTDDGEFVISYGGNLDIYLSPIRKNYQTLETEYRITKENYYLFETFNTLYEKLINYQFLSIEDPKHREMEKRIDQNREYPLIQNDIVNWYSDEDMIEEASLLQISKKDEDTIKLVFHQSNRKDYNTYSIRIRNNGSRYDHANHIFMEMYNKLTYQNDDYYPQVHIEEYLYEQKRVLKR